MQKKVRIASRFPLQFKKAAYRQGAAFLLVLMLELKQKYLAQSRQGAKKNDKYLPPDYRKKVRPRLAWAMQEVRVQGGGEIIFTGMPAGIARIEKLAWAMDEVERSRMPEPRVTQEQLPRRHGELLYPLSLRERVRERG